MKIESVLCIAVVGACGLASIGALAAPALADGDEPHWDYSGQALWGALEDTHQSMPPLMYPYATCSIGVAQSPVNLADQLRPNSLNLLSVNYRTDTPDFYNSGHAVQVNPSENYKGTLSIGKDVYPLTQFHFHAPSEHVIGTQTFAGELHFVHIRGDGRIAVLGVLLEEGAANPALQVILDNTPPSAKTHNPDTGISLNPRSLLPRDTKHFYTYAGSLTTPPCSEGVGWYVLAQPLTVSAAQIAQLETLYADNNRVPQDLNSRVVTGNVK